MRASLAPLTSDARRQRLREAWASLLGEIVPATDPVVELHAIQEGPDARLERVRLAVEPGIVVPVLVFTPASPPRGRRAAVVALSQHGKAHFIRERAGEIAALVAGGASVCLPDLRGLGETSPGRRAVSPGAS